MNKHDALWDFSPEVASLLQKIPADDERLLDLRQRLVQAVKRIDPNHLYPPPHNFEAEMGLLGAILANNRAFEKVSDFLRPEHFADATHGRIYEAAGKLIEQGQIADSVTLRARFEKDEGLAAIGGPEYLTKLAASVVTFINSRDYGRTIHECWLRRQVIELGWGAAEGAFDKEADGEDIVAGVIGKAEALLTTGARHGVSRREVIGELAAGLENKLACDGTGIPALDMAMGGGLYAGKLYGLAGRKKMGKSLLLGTISHNLSERGVRHLIVPCEMGREEFEQRSVGRALGFNAMAFLQGKHRDDPAFREKVAAYGASAPNYAIYTDAPGARFEDLRRIVSRHIAQNGIHGFMLDYLQLVQGRERGQSRAEHLDAVAQWIADTCRNHGVWALVAAQINQDRDGPNIRYSEGLRLACDQLYALMPCERFESGRWLACWESRYTPRQSVGSEHSPGLILQTAAGPYFSEADPEIIEGLDAA